MQETRPTKLKGKETVSDVKKQRIPFGVNRNDSEDFNFMLYSKTKAEK